MAGGTEGTEGHGDIERWPNRDGTAICFDRVRPLFDIAIGSAAAFSLICGCGSLAIPVTKLWRGAKTAAVTAEGRAWFIHADSDFCEQWSFFNLALLKKNWTLDWRWKSSSAAFANIGWSLHVLLPPQWSQRQYPCYSWQGRTVVAASTEPHMTLGVFPGNMDSFQLAFIGDSFPDNSHPRLKTFLNLWDVHPADLYRIAVRFACDPWKPKEKGRGTEEPHEFAALHWGQVSQMVQVQRCRPVAFFRSGAHHGPACIMARPGSRCGPSCLSTSWRCWSFQSVQDLKTQMDKICLLAMQITEEPLMPVTDLPAFTGQTILGPHRMILCYN